MFQYLTILSISILVSAAKAETYSVNGQQSTKVEALKALIANPNASVTRCQDVTLSPKATLVVKKTKKVKGA